MRDAVAAITSALSELIEARNALPEEFAAEIDRVIEQTRVLLASLGGATRADSASEGDAQSAQATPAAPEV